MRPRPRWISSPEVSTTCATRIAAPPHVARRHHPYNLAPSSRPPATDVEEQVRDAVDVDAARFIGATIRLFDVEVLVVQVPPRVLGDRVEAPALVAAFHARFGHTIVLVAQDRRGVPTFFGPGPIAMVLAAIPFGALAWKRYRFRPPRPQMLPIPIDPPPSYTSDDYALSDEVGAPTRDLKRRTRTLPR